MCCFNFIFKPAQKVHSSTNLSSKLLSKVMLLIEKLNTDYSWTLPCFPSETFPVATNTDVLLSHINLFKTILLPWMELPQSIPGRMEFEINFVKLMMTGFLSGLKTWTMGVGAIRRNFVSTLCFCFPFRFVGNAFCLFVSSTTLRQKAFSFAPAAPTKENRQQKHNE